MMEDKDVHDKLIAELESGMAPDESDPEAVFTAQLEAWFKVDYEKEFIRVQYQRMVAIGKRVDQNINLDPVIEQFGQAKMELDVIEGLMVDFLKAELDFEVIKRMVEKSHYYPPRGVAYNVPDNLKKRLLEATAS